MARPTELCAVALTVPELTILAALNEPEDTEMLPLFVKLLALKEPWVTVMVPLLITVFKLSKPGDTETVPLLIKLPAARKKKKIPPEEVVNVPLLTTFPSRRRSAPDTAMVPLLVTLSMTLRKRPRGPPKLTTFRVPVPVLVMVPPEIKAPEMLSGPVAEVSARTPPVTGLSAGLLSSQPSRTTVSCARSMWTFGKLGSAMNWSAVSRPPKPTVAPSATCTVPAARVHAYALPSAH